MDQWNTFVINLAREKSYNGQPANTFRIPEVYIQADLEGVDADHPYTFYVDSIQLYPAYQP